VFLDIGAPEEILMIHLAQELKALRRRLVSPTAAFEHITSYFKNKRAIGALTRFLRVAIGKRLATPRDGKEFRKLFGL
jgi:hypothetical protein